MTNTAQEALAQLRDEAIALIKATPDLAAFAPLPANLKPADLPPVPLAAVDRFISNPGTHIPATAAFTNAALAAAPFGHWRQTYTEAEVGAHFLAHYGWLELWGPTGHFQCDSARAYVAFWGPGLHYDWHFHQAEEIYFLATGEALFKAEGAEDAIIRTGQTRLHASNQPHATTTSDSSILTLVLWRGEGLAGNARMQS
ncbi:MAG: dimethylsulfonioproprionate lyase family protein [Pikeienuella sp.]